DRGAGLRWRSRRAGRHHRGPAVSGAPQRGAHGMGSPAAWADLEPALPQITATMRRYLTEIGCVLRPGSVGGADLALRCFAGFLIENAPEVTSTAQVTRPPHRGLQALARPPARAEQAAADHRDHRPPA